MNAAVFIDRDGVIIEDPPHYAHLPEQVNLVAGAAEAISLLNQTGFKVVVISNQSGVARGYYPESDVARFHEIMHQKLEQAGAHVDGVYYCPHHPQAAVARYRRDCDCRKPGPGMLQKAARDLEIDLSASCMIGDKMDDIWAGRNAGCKSSILVLTGYGPGEARQQGETSPDFIAADLRAATALFVNGAVAMKKKGDT